jgi:axin 2
MTPVEPAAFAAELISRLEKLKLELESHHSLEERLQQIREVVLPHPCCHPACMHACAQILGIGSSPLPGSLSLCCFHFQDEEKEGSEQALSSREGMPTQQPLSLLPSGSYEEDPQTILDDHLSRVLKTPGCQSPGVGHYSPRSRSPDHHYHHHQQYHSLLPPGGKLPPAAACPFLGGKGFVTKQMTKHVHHHYIHHHAGPKTKEEIEAEATQRVRCFCPGVTEYYSYSKCKSHPKVPEGTAGDQFR